MEDPLAIHEQVDKLKEKGLSFRTNICNLQGSCVKEHTPLRQPHGGHALPLFPSDIKRKGRDGYEVRERRLAPKMLTWSEALGLLLTEDMSSPSLKATHVGTAHLSSFPPLPCLLAAATHQLRSERPPHARENGLTPGHWLPSNSWKGKPVSTNRIQQYGGDATECWLKPWCQRRRSPMAPDSFQGTPVGAGTPEGSAPPQAHSAPGEAPRLHSQASTPYFLITEERE